MPISVTCSKCDKKLKVPDTAAGKKIRCPACKAVFAVPKAEELVEPDDDLVLPDEETAVSEAPQPAKKKAARDKDTEEDDEGYGLDEEDEAERKRRKKRNKRRRAEEEDDDAERRSPRGEAHRGVLILVLGIVAILCACLCAIIGWALGSIVLNMASTDLAKMQNRSMDRSGQGLTTAGKACAIIACAVGLVNIIAGIALRLNGKLPL